MSKSYTEIKTFVKSLKKLVIELGLNFYENEVMLKTLKEILLKQIDLIKESQDDSMEFMSKVLGNFDVFNDFDDSKNKSFINNSGFVSEVLDFLKKSISSISTVDEEELSKYDDVWDWFLECFLITDKTLGFGMERLVFECLDGVSYEDESNDDLRDDGFYVYGWFENEPNKKCRFFIKGNKCEKMNNVQGRNFVVTRIGNGCETLGLYSVVGKGMDEVFLPSSLKKIESGAFSESGVKRIVIPASVKCIENYSFENLNNLEDVVFPDDIIKDNFNKDEGLAGLFSECNKFFINKLQDIKSGNETKNWVDFLLYVPYFVRCDKYSSFMIEDIIDDLMPLVEKFLLQKFGCFNGYLYMMKANKSLVEWLNIDEYDEYDYSKIAYDDFEKDIMVRNLNFFSSYYNYSNGIPNSYTPLFGDLEYKHLLEVSYLSEEERDQMARYSMDDYVKQREFIYKNILEFRCDDFNNIDAAKSNNLARWAFEYCMLVLKSSDLSKERVYDEMHNKIVKILKEQMNGIFGYSEIKASSLSVSDALDVFRPDLLIGHYETFASLKKLIDYLIENDHYIPEYDCIHGFLVNLFSLHNDGISYNACYDKLKKFGCFHRNDIMEWFEGYKKKMELAINNNWKWGMDNYQKLLSNEESMIDLILRERRVWLGMDKKQIIADVMAVYRRDLVAYDDTYSCMNPTCSSSEKIPLRMLQCIKSDFFRSCSWFYSDFIEMVRIIIDEYGIEQCKSICEVVAMEKNVAAGYHYGKVKEDKNKNN